MPKTFISVQLLSCVQLFTTPWTAALHASLSNINSCNLLILMSVESVMPSNHFILCHPLLLLPSIPPSISVFSNESVLHIRWPKYWSFSFNICPSNEYSGLISLGLTGLISVLSKGLSRVFSNTTVQKHQFFNAQPNSSCCRKGPKSCPILFRSSQQVGPLPPRTFTLPFPLPGVSLLQIFPRRPQRVVSVSAQRALSHRAVPACPACSHHAHRLVQHRSSAPGPALHPHPC